MADDLQPIVDRFIEDYVWPRYGALGGPDEDECREIVRAVLGAANASASIDSRKDT